MGHLAAAIHPELLVTVGDMSRHINAAACAKGLNAKRIMHFSNISELLAAKIHWRDLTDVLFVKASHGIKLQQLVTALTSSPEADA